MQLQTIVYSRGQCIDIIPSQPRTYFVTKMYSIVFIAKLDFLTSATLAVIFYVTVKANCSNSNKTILQFSIISKVLNVFP